MVSAADRPSSQAAWVSLEGTGSGSKGSLWSDFREHLSRRLNNISHCMVEMVDLGGIGSNCMSIQFRLKVELIHFMQSA